MSDKPYIFEFAASFPSDAEQSLRSIRSRIRSCFSIEWGTIVAGTFIDSFPKGNGYYWRICFSPRLMDLIAKALRESIESKIPPYCNKGQDWMEEFRQLLALETDDAKWQTCFYPDGQALFVLPGVNMATHLYEAFKKFKENVDLLNYRTKEF